jgi:hypothetical protein
MVSGWGASQSSSPRNHCSCNTSLSPNSLVIGSVLCPHGLWWPGPYIPGRHWIGGEKEKGGKVYWYSDFFFGEKITAMIRHMFLSCVAYFYVRRQTSSVPPKDTILHYLTLSYTILHNLTLSYTILHYLTLSYTILHYLTLSYTILHSIIHYPFFSDCQMEVEVGSPCVTLSVNLCEICV